MWSAMIYYDEERLGCVGCFGLRSREEAIAWLSHGFDWSRCWYMLPSWTIRKER